MKVYTRNGFTSISLIKAYQFVTLQICMYINGMFQARLWVQIMQELRQGVRLRKVEHVQLSPLEYELTPFEILLEDIRLGRFKLNRVMVRFLNLWIDPFITLIIWVTQDFGTYSIRKQLRRSLVRVFAFHIHKL